jgi:hypothetical protein
MTRARGLDFALLLLAAACLLFGGGLGCEEDADGVKFKMDEFNGVQYMGINGKKPPGEGSLRLPYNMEPPYFGKVSLGIINTDLIQQTQNAVGYAQLERSDLAESIRAEIRYELTPSIGVRISSNLSLDTAFCAGASQALVRIDDDGTDAMVRYQCPGATSWSDLVTDSSLYDADEDWYFRVGGFGIDKKGQIGFYNYRFGSGAPVSPTPERAATFATFEMLRFGLKADYHLLDNELIDAQDDGNSAFSNLITARSLTDPDFGTANFGDTKVPKDLIKIDKGFFKIYQAKFDGKEQSYVKKWPKLADQIACALDDMDDFD